MEQINQPRGDGNEITTRDEPIIYEASSTNPPLTFAEAERRNAYSLLTELHDHALTFEANGGHPGDPRSHHLTELALSAAVVAWWSRWQPITMHRAFIRGASLAEVAAAAGTSEAETFERWARWADAQAELIIAERRALDPDEVAAIRARLGISDPAM